MYDFIIQYAVETVNPVLVRRKNMELRISFSCDYMEGAHPAILQRLIETNFTQMPGYGADDCCDGCFTGRYAIPRPEPEPVDVSMRPIE